MRSTMYPSALKTLCLSLALAAAATLARPIERRQVPLKYFISHHTGSMIHVDPEGNITGRPVDGYSPGKFFIRQGGSSSGDGAFRHNLSLHSEDHNGSYLHFVQLVPVTSNDSAVELSGSGSTNETEEFANATVAVAVEEVEATPVLMLVIGEIGVEDEEGVIRHTMWTEETSGPFYRYSVTLHDGKVCYLAFNLDGSPVKNPCLSAEELLTKALFFHYRAF